MGYLNAGYAPCNADGDVNKVHPDLKKITDLNQLLGWSAKNKDGTIDAAKLFCFKVIIKAGDLETEEDRCNPHVLYQLKWKKKRYQTQEIKGVNKDPKWNYEKVHKIEEINEQVLD